MDSAEDIRRMNVNELCGWLKKQLSEKRWKVAEQVIPEQDIMGSNFLDITKADCKSVGLPLGVAVSLVQIAQGVLGSGAPVVGYSLLSTLNKLFMKKCVASPIIKSDDKKLFAVCCSDFIIN
jgi:hypothetical protein